MKSVYTSWNKIISLSYRHWANFPLTNHIFSCYSNSIGFGDGGAQPLNGKDVNFSILVVLNARSNENSQLRISMRLRFWKKKLNANQSQESVLEAFNSSEQDANCRGFVGPTRKIQFTNLLCCSFYIVLFVEWVRKYMFPTFHKFWFMFIVDKNCWPNRKYSVLIYFGKCIVRSHFFFNSQILYMIMFDNIFIISWVL